MHYGVLAKTYEALESTSKRLEMTDILVQLFKETPPEIIDKVIFLTQGKLHPSWLGFPEIGIAEKTAIKGVAQAINTKPEEVVKAVNKFGDLGSALEKLEKKQIKDLLSFTGERKKTRFSSPITVEEVYKELDEIAQVSGTGSADVKVQKLADLLRSVEAKAGKWILRAVLGKLRFGIADQTILDALAVTFTGDKKNKEIIERGYNIHPNLGEIAKLLSTKGLDAITKMKIEIFTPVRMMLAQRLSSIDEILEKLGGKCGVERKYDGERIQAHKSGKEVKLFSRNLENPTSQYPDVCELIRSLKANEVVVEGECVAIDPETGDLRPFQELMHRRRRYSIQEAKDKYPISLFLFDILKIGEKDLLDEPYPTRRKYLEGIIEETKRLKLATALISDSVPEIQTFFDSSIESGCEGIIAKSVQSDSIYQPGARGWLWVKLKQSYQKLADTIDVVIVGAYFGRGKRAQMYGALLCAVLDKNDGTYKTISKVGSGFRDTDLIENMKKFEEIKSDTKPLQVVSVIKPLPDIWFEPKLVAEIRGDEITLSTVHSAGFGEIRPNSGLAVRFPRFIRWREDKSAEDSTTTDEIIEMYKQQIKQV